MKFEELKIILKRLYKDHVNRYLNRIFLSLFLSLVVSLSTSAIAWLLDPAVKKIFIEDNQTYAWAIPLAIIIAFSAKGICLYFARVLLIKTGQEVSGELQTKVAKYILNTDISTIEKKHSGKFISNISFDASQVNSLCSTGILNSMKDSLTLIALIGVMVYQNWKLTLFALIMMPLAAGLAKSLGKRIGKAVTEAGEISGRLTSHLSEILKASKMIRIYQKEDVEFEKSKNIIFQMVNKGAKISSIIVRATPLMEILTGFMIAGFIYFSGTLISSGELQVNQFFSFLAAMMLAYQPIRSLATINMVVFSGAAGAKRIYKVIDQPIKINNDKSLPDLKSSDGNIKFSNVSFKYENSNDKAINDINFDIKGGSMAAFVGHSGAGKSTIINLLPRFYDPQNGEIYIDNQNTKSVNLNSLRKTISLVSQDVILFDSTVKENILYAKKDASEKEFSEACKFAAADEFINDLPQKHNTLIGENGIRLSGGQKQRLSIARAILKRSPIILLDEATSSLDAESEEIVQSAIKNLTKNKTTLVIAHRLSTIHNADKIFVIKKGNLIDSGSHENLIKNCDYYKLLYEKQLK
ncbi:ABC transporter ATP-binding protein/permease [Pelagibacteraceae bacterium]|nr:ABC transporter ATP-binding protein/permease [Pelagibacteraceae bacterium]